MLNLSFSRSINKLAAVKAKGKGVSMIKLGFTSWNFYAAVAVIAVIIPVVKN